MTFKVGDRVRFLGAPNYRPTGSLGTVIGFAHHDKNSPLVDFDNGDRGSHPGRAWLELVAPPVYTDKELADEYRKVRAEFTKLSEELEERGFTLRCERSGSRLLVPAKDITIIKTVTEVIEL